MTTHASAVRGQGQHRMGVIGATLAALNSRLPGSVCDQSRSPEFANGRAGGFEPQGHESR